MWIGEAVAAFDRASGDDGLILVDDLSRRAAALGFANDDTSARSVVGHHLSPVVGWVRLDGVDGVDPGRHRGSWIDRVRASAEVLVASASPSRIPHGRQT